MRQRGEVGLIGRLPVRARMWSSAVVEDEVLADGSPGLGHRVVGSEIYLLVLTDRQSRSTKTLSRHEPLPSMLMAMPFLINTPVNSALVTSICAQHARLAERAFQKIILQRQLSDLRMERLQIHRRCGGTGLGFRPEYPGSPSQKLRLPLRDLPTRPTSSRPSMQPMPLSP